ncbi:Fe-S cluster assembly protein SufD [Pseudoluteimonas lycopersici]|uniref:Fe-S cluster assembly protein SufD n=1 Tax=Pseudoluteimonas lycopersici TaxID=1324796 RepID=A0A516V4P4_9GAMM|nr:SufD family Fe-S cluster assembly protein [Lysobacter lycopersici]QDQ73468.1 Fe-S cluster assembly protein SufD [Lysobacter lycopersici]
MRALLDELGLRENQASRESWRYSRTAIRALSQQDFVIADGTAAVPDALRERYELAETNGRRIVFVNGAFSAEHSDFAGDDVEVAHAGGTTTLTGWNGDVDPIHLVYLSIPGFAPSQWAHELAIDLRGPASIFEQHLGESGANVLGVLRVNLDIARYTPIRTVTLCELPDSASLIRRVQSNLPEDVDFDATFALFGGRLQRHEIAVGLAERVATHASRGVFVLGAREHVDVRLDVSHSAPDTGCDLVWRGIAGGRARGILHGGITIDEGADGSEATLSNKNLLLSENAEIDTQPVLEIHADEVKAAHGATVGQLDPTALFYLRSRGIPETDARRLLTAAFCREIVAGVDDETLRAALDAALDRALARIAA